mmetsp:Transcript_2074/g.3289  ORF Transcript_2074/g.3289 Transcript_2074/m.3289 type:complete len:333 (+) Transcript_2074:104-1102(+)|eukprot:CAMPEP_0119104690 /NCGR_PEP_ID=MMETSP1180-20130426/2842_1 /TAXON_ID=3052 ORGANISM="Chlamydomonas cf sp, Strain CCMP681" /NCGR_SAMPLE_ID=MMETSP1180 /ASSEMBLY_ACC=CAM_ASM_000741 /LENGTH=332 /DNA_ID=CAMNT_0007089515 /DNA_START=103 /DNA_END=1101 /DNA_ORIENTATION=-
MDDHKDSQGPLHAHDALLPPLARGTSVAEVQFRRLLFSTESQLAVALDEVASTQRQQQQQQCHTGKDGQPIRPLPFFSSIAKLKHYFSTLQDQLADLERGQFTLSIPPESLAAYRFHLSQLAAQLPSANLPPFCIKPVAKAGVPKGLTVASMSAAAESALGTALPGEAGGSAPLQQTFQGGLGGLARSHLDQQDALQEELTDELAGMAASLKASTYGLQDAVRARGALVDGTEVVLERNVDNVRKVAQDSAKQFTRSSHGFCFTCMVLLLVGAVFTVLAVYIKLTHLTGYRAPRSVTSSGGGKGGLSWLWGLVAGRGSAPGINAESWANAEL